MMRSSALQYSTSEYASHYRKSLLSVWLIILNGISLILLLFFYEQIMDLSLYYVSNMGSVYVIVSLAMLCFTVRKGVWSGSFVYLLVFSLFHFGMTFVYGINLPISDYDSYYMNQWFYSSFTKEAIYASTLSVNAYTTGCMILNLKKYSRDTGITYKKSKFPLSGAIITIICLMSWFVLVISKGGVSILFGSYENFLFQTNSLPLPYIYYGIGIGIGFLLSGGKSKIQYLALFMLAVWSVFAMILGLRNELLVPVVTGLVVMAKYKIPFSFKTVLILGICLLSILSIVRDLRKTGLNDSGNITINANPLSSLVEMGGSLRPVSEVILWHETGDSFIYGASYWAPIDRTIQLILPDLRASRLDSQNDYRLMNVLIQKRTGPVGFSPVAESYYNFGIFGVCIIMLLTGLLVSFMDTWRVTYFNQACFAVIFVALIGEVRQDFTPVPFQIVFGLCLVIFVSVLDNKFFHVK